MAFHLPLSMTPGFPEWLLGRKMRGCFVLLCIMMLCGCAGDGASQKSPTQPPPLVVIQPAQVPADVDSLMHFIKLDMLDYAQAKAMSMPPAAVSIAFPQYTSWIGTVEAAVQSDVGFPTNFAMISTGAVQEFSNFSGIHYQCVGTPSCKDTSLQQAEVEGINLQAVGQGIAMHYQGQSAATKMAAAQYLTQHYSIQGQASPK